MDNTSGNRKFQISYKVTDVAKEYNDCQEIYWKFLAEGKNAIPAKKVTGKITLPEHISNFDNFKVWAHGDVNGKVEKLNNKTVSFEIDRLSPGAMVELRILSSEKILRNIPEIRISRFNSYNNIVSYEEKLSNDTDKNIENSRSKIEMYVITELLLIIILIFKLKKLKQISKEKKLEKHDLKYYRDIPRENTATPSEALYMIKFNKKRLDTGRIQRDAIAAIILDLCLKKKISLTNKDGTTFVKILNTSDDLKNDEREVYNLLKKAGNGEEEFDIAKLNQYAKKEYYEYSVDINNVVNATINNLYELKLIDKARCKLYLKWESAPIKYMLIKNIYIWVIITNIIANIFFQKQMAFGMGYGLLTNITYTIIGILPLILIRLYHLKKQEKILKKIAVLTQEGNDEKEKWQAFKRYIEDYSLLKEKDVPDLVVWEKYLVYATAFGISEKVIESLKATYPEVFIKERWNDGSMSENYPVINYIFNPLNNDYNSSSNLKLGNISINNISSNISKAYHTSVTEIASHSSSSSGSGGGFSSGGGGRWRPVAGMGGR